MSTWPTNRSEFGENRTPVLIGLSSADGVTIVPVAVDHATGAVLTEGGGGGGGGTSSTFGAAFPTTGTAVGATDGTDMQPFLVDGSGNLKVAVESGGGGGTQYTDGGTPPAHPVGTMPIFNNGGTWSEVAVANPLPVQTPLISASGNITSTQTVTISCGGYGAVGAQVTGTWTGQINIQGSIDGTNYISTTGALLTSGILVNDLVSNNIVQIQASGLKYIQLIGATVNTGTAVVTLTANQAISNVMIDNSLPTGSNIIGSVTVESGGNIAGVDSSSRLSTLAAQPTAANLNATVVGTGTFAAQVASSTATGSAVPANAFYSGISDQSGKLTGAVSANTAAGTTGNGLLGTGNLGYDGTNWRQLAVTGSAGNLAIGGGGTNVPIKDDTNYGDGVTSGILSVTGRLWNGTNYDRPRSGGVTGMAGVSLQASASGGYTYLHIAAGQATTTVKSGAGTLHAIVFNSAATATNVTTIYDNTAGSGTVIGIPAATAVTTPESVIYDLAFATGLTFVTATANGSDMTVVYK